MGRREAGEREREREVGKAGKVERERDRQTDRQAQWREGGEVELGARERERYRKERGVTEIVKSVGTQAQGGGRGRGGEGWGG